MKLTDFLFIPVGKVFFTIRKVFQKNLYMSREQVLWLRFKFSDLSFEEFWRHEACFYYKADYIKNYSKTICNMPFCEIFFKKEISNIKFFFNKIRLDFYSKFDRFNQ